MPVSVGSQGPYVVGRPVRIYAEFLDINGADYDPLVVTLKYLPPTGARVTIATPNAAIVKDSVGNYHFIADTTGWASGRVTYRWEGTGNPPVADDGVFVIKGSPLSP